MYTLTILHPRDTQILECGIPNYRKRLFLESWHSTMDSDTINERKAFPHAYMPLIQNQGRHQQRTSTMNFQLSSDEGGQKSPKIKKKKSDGLKKRFKNFLHWIETFFFYLMFYAEEKKGHFGLCSELSFFEE